MQLIESVDPEADLAYELHKTFFGPNTAMKLPVRRHPDIHKLLTSRMKESQVSNYLESLVSWFKKPTVAEHFGSNEEHEEENSDQDTGDAGNDRAPCRTDVALPKPGSVRHFAVAALAAAAGDT